MSRLCQDLWYILQPASRWQSKSFGLSFGKRPCRASLYILRSRFCQGAEGLTASCPVTWTQSCQPADSALCCWRISILLSTKCCGRTLNPSDSYEQQQQQQQARCWRGDVLEKTTVMYKHLLKHTLTTTKAHTHIDSCTFTWVRTPIGIMHPLDPDPWP